MELPDPNDFAAQQAIEFFEPEPAPARVLDLPAFDLAEYLAHHLYDGWWRVQNTFSRYPELDG